MLATAKLVFYSSLVQTIKLSGWRVAVDVCEEIGRQVTNQELFHQCMRIRPAFRGNSSWDQGVNYTKKGSSVVVTQCDVADKLGMTRKKATTGVPSQPILDIEGHVGYIIVTKKLVRKLHCFEVQMMIQKLWLFVTPRSSRNTIKGERFAGK